MDFNVLHLSKTVLISYIVAWLYFFITLPFFIKFLGKIKGSFINYWISWGVMILVGWFIEAKYFDFI
jgi:hypothetical protein